MRWCNLGTRCALALGILVLIVLTTVSASAQDVTPIPPVPTAQPAPDVAKIAPPTPLGDLAGKPVARVAVELGGNIWDDVTVPSVKSVKPGDILTPALARRALDELMATGAYARGEVTATAENGGALLVVRVVPRKLIQKLEVELHGAPFDYDDLLHSADLGEGGEIVGADIGQVKDRIVRFSALHGYPSAHVEIKTRATDDPMRTFVMVNVQPGQPRTIDERRFYVFGSGAGKVMDLTGAYGVRPGGRADEPAIAAADLALEQALHAAGWYRARVSHDLVWVGPPGEQRVLLRVRVDAGTLLVPRFEGNTHYDDATLTAALGLDTETDRSPTHLADKLVAFYQKRGFLDVEVRPELRGTEADPVQVLLFHVVEHSRVAVVARRYPCLKLEAVRHLSNGGPRSSAEIGTEIDSYLEEELPGAELFVDPDPKSVSANVGAGAGDIATGARPVPIDLKPDATFVADTYERAAEHVQELYRNEGFLHAIVGPVQVVRARCDPRSPPGKCIPLPLPPPPVDVCTYDSAGLPVPVQPLDASFTCRPGGTKDVECAPTMELVIPVKLGPRTQIWDVAFTGVKSASEQEVADAADVPVGDYVSTAQLDDARRRIVDWYKELGYFYVDVKYTLEPSLDNTRARVRFDVTEGDQVIVTDITIRGLDATRESVVRRRIALTAGQPYRTSDVRKTQERLATLGVFSSISVALADPYVPAPRKGVIIDVVEAASQYVEVRPGFSTGEGVRGVLEYGHRNLLGYAVSVTAHVQASYLPDFLILDPQVAQNYGPLSTADRIATRNTLTFGFPEMGLGPTVRSQLDGVYVRDLERDFTLTKAAVAGTMIWRPVREVQVSGGPDYENNNVYLFQFNTVQSYLNSPANQGNSELSRLLRVPDGESNVVAAKLGVTWDRRDNPFNAHRGTYFAAGVEDVNAYPVQGTPAIANEQFENHGLRLTQTLAGYIPITKTISFAAELRLGEFVNVLACRAPFDHNPKDIPPPYCTYPDRQFFMGGFDSMRGWLQDAFIPQDYIDQIDAGKIVCTSQSNCQVPLRGGNFMVNPRFELRFPVRAPLDLALFSDFGNLWTDPGYILQHGIAVRADVGAGVRVETPVGPLVFDYGFNVTRKSYEDLGAFHFAIGLF
jgi:outer membrane protein insertion porin family